MASKWEKMNKRVTNAQAALARRFSDAGLTSYTKAIKAFADRDEEQIEAWKRELRGQLAKDTDEQLS